MFAINKLVAQLSRFHQPFQTKTCALPTQTKIVRYVASNQLSWPKRYCTHAKRLYRQIKEVKLNKVIERAGHKEHKLKGLRYNTLCSISYTDILKKELIKNPNSFLNTDNKGQRHIDNLLTQAQKHPHIMKALVDAVKQQPKVMTMMLKAATRHPSTKIIFLNLFDKVDTESCPIINQLIAQAKSSPEIALNFSHLIAKNTVFFTQIVMKPKLNSKLLSLIVHIACNNPKKHTNLIMNLLSTDGIEKLKLAITTNIEDSNLECYLTKPEQFKFATKKFSLSDLPQGTCATSLLDEIEKKDPKALFLMAIYFNELTKNTLVSKETIQKRALGLHREFKKESLAQVKLHETHQKAIDLQCYSKYKVGLKEGLQKLYMPDGTIKPHAFTALRCGFPLKVDQFIQEIVYDDRKTGGAVQARTHDYMEQLDEEVTSLNTLGDKACQDTIFEEDIPLISLSFDLHSHLIGGYYLPNEKKENIESIRDAFENGLHAHEELKDQNQINIIRNTLKRAFPKLPIAVIEKNARSIYTSRPTWGTNGEDQTFIAIADLTTPNKKSTDESKPEDLYNDFMVQCSPKAMDCKIITEKIVQSYNLDKKDVDHFYMQDRQMRLLITKEHKCPVDFKLIPPDRHKAKYDIWKQNTKARIHALKEQNAALNDLPIASA